MIELLVKRPDGSFDIQVICELFKLGSKVFQNAEELAELLASKKARLSYSLEIQRAGSKKRLTRVSSRNTVTVRRLTPGSYTVRYKVVAIQGSKKIESRFSPRARVRG